VRIPDPIISYRVSGLVEEGSSDDTWRGQPGSDKV
jgi:hypothetical protein